MSYKSCILAVPTERVSAEELLQAIRAELARHFEQMAPVLKQLPTAAHVLMNSPEEAEACGLRFFAVGIDGYKTERSFFDYAGGGALPLVKIQHDDQHGIYLFETHHLPAKRSTWLMSDGPYLGGHVKKFAAVDYAQKGYTNEDLQRLNRKTEDTLTGAEYRAVAEYSNAVQIALRKYFPRAVGTGYLDILRNETAMMGFGGEGGSELSDVAVPRPQEWSNLIYSAPSKADWKKAKLRRRVY